jgi:Domain of unknown function (DUF4349)
MKLRDHDMPLDPDTERELAAVDAGLLGLDVAPDLEDLAQLARDARAEAPAPESDFAAKLDEWAAAGFPRDGRVSDGGEGERGPARGGLRERLGTVPPRRLLLPVGAAATVLVAAAVGISVSDQLGGSSQTAPSIQGVPGTVAESSGTGGAGGTANDRIQPPTTAGSPSFDQSQPSLESKASRATPLARSTAGALGSATTPGGPRKVAQTADLVLSTEPQDVRDVADGVVSVVDRYGGFVVSSNVTSGRAPGPTPVPESAHGNAGRSQQGSGTFELKIPAQHLQAALGDMSKLAHVTSRTEGVKDITKHFDAAKNHLHDLNVVRAHLLRKLGNAITVTEQESLKARLQVVENQLAAARDSYRQVQSRIRLVPVSVEIRGQAGVDSGGGGAWSIGDAFHDAGRVLTVMAGILLISAAVLVPIGLIVGVAWLTARAVIRKRREDTLE